MLSESPGSLCISVLPVAAVAGFWKQLRGCEGWGSFLKRTLFWVA